jgi:hypothetical protein
MPVIYDGQTYHTLEEVSAHLDKVIDEQSAILRVNLRGKKEQTKEQSILQVA